MMSQKLSEMFSPNQLKEQVVVLVETDDYDQLSTAFCALHYADEFADVSVRKLGMFTSVWVNDEIHNYVSDPIDIGGKKWIVVV